MSVRALCVIGLLSFSALAVYPSYVSLDHTDPVTHRTFRAVSEEWYRWTLNGHAPFPYQWRVLGSWMVRAIERPTRADPHAIDVCLKVAALAVSAAALFTVADAIAGATVALASLGFYFALTAGAFASQGYDMYYTNDYLMVAGWFVVVALVARRRYGAAALVTFVAAWAKETMLLAVVLVAFRWWRGEAKMKDVVLVGLAYAVPTIALRALYPAPLSDWAWWHMLAANAVSLRNNVKVLVFFNVLWVTTWLAVKRSEQTLVRDLAATLVVYVLLAYVVVNIRELRHFLPLAILLLPCGLGELQRRLNPA